MTMQLSRLLDLVDAKYRYDAAHFRALGSVASDIYLDSASDLVEAARLLDRPIRRTDTDGDTKVLSVDYRGVTFRYVGTVGPEEAI